MSSIPWDPITSVRSREFDRRQDALARHLEWRSSSGEPCCGRSQRCEKKASAERVVAVVLSHSSPLSSCFCETTIRSFGRRCETVASRCEMSS